MVAQHLSKHRFTRSDPIHFYPDEGGVVYRGLARKFRNHPIENENGDLIRVQGRSTGKVSSRTTMGEQKED